MPQASPITGFWGWPALKDGLSADQPHIELCDSSWLVSVIIERRELAAMPSGKQTFK